MMTATTNNHWVVIHGLTDCGWLPVEFVWWKCPASLVIVLWVQFSLLTISLAETWASKSLDCPLIFFNTKSQHASQSKKTCPMETKVFFRFLFCEHLLQQNQIWTNHTICTCKKHHLRFSCFWIHQNQIKQEVPIHHAQPQSTILSFRLSFIGQFGRCRLTL